MSDKAYRIADGDECHEYYGCWATLLGPDDFVCTLGEPEDRTWIRDGQDVVDRLNEQHDELQRLREENQRLRDENLRLLDDIDAWKDASGLVDAHGDPDGVTPHNAKAYWEGIEQQALGSLSRVAYLEDRLRKLHGKDEK